MKYPKDQYDTLVKCLEKLNEVFDLKEALSNNAVLFLLYRRVHTHFNEGFQHNNLFVSSAGVLTVGHKRVEGETYKTFLPFEGEFPFYPEGCDDSHILTAMKKAVNTILKKA